jgi:hypothetical protein
MTNLPIKDYDEVLKYKNQRIFWSPHEALIGFQVNKRTTTCPANASYLSSPVRLKFSVR